MEDRSHISLWRHGIKEIHLLLMIIFLAAAARVYHSFHILLSDEAYNLITIENLVFQKGFHPYFFKHPPLYTLLSAVLCYIVGPYPQIPAYISIFFSVISLIPFYLIINSLFGGRIALWAAFSLAFMPANVYYSTWIKQDAMLLFFFLWGIYFYLKGRYASAGLAIGIALLVKEFALFFFPLSFLIALITGRKGSTWRGYLIMILVALSLSLWWYFLFGAMFYLIAGEALTGAYIVEWYWHYPWWFFLKNLPYDLSYPILITFFIGVLFIIAQKSGLKAGCYIILSWITVLYIPISLLHMKTPWFIYLATPALAAVAGFGVDRFYELLRSRPVKIIFLCLAIISPIFSMYLFENERYYEQLTGIKRPRQLAKEVQGGTWREMAWKKEYWSKKVEGIERVGFLQVTPALQYLMGIDEKDIVFLSASKFMARDKEELSQFANEKSIGAFIINAESLTYTEKNLKDMVSLWGEPEKAGSFLIFRTGLP